MGDLGLAWEQFCDALRAAGSDVLRQAPDIELDRAEGIRYLTRLTRSAFELAFETAGPDSPRIEPMYAQRTSIAQRNPDQVYLRAKVDPRHEYRIRGRRGSGGALSFVTRCSRGPDEGITGFLDGSTLVCDGDGGFEIIAGTDPRDRNWLAMSATTDTLAVRELFDDPDGAVVSAVTIERSDGRREDAPLTERAVADSLVTATAMIQGILRRFGGWTELCAQRPNQLWAEDDLAGPGGVVAVGGSPGINYCLGYWELNPDQALVLRVPPVPGVRWAFQLMNFWHENLNLPWSGSNLNQTTARPSPTGSYEMVIAGRDPGIANWVDTDGHDHGVMLFRWFAEVHDQPLPDAQVVPWSEIAPDSSGGSGRRRTLIAPGYLAPRVG